VRRRREIGIRAALGAGPRRVLAGVLSAVARQVATGIVVGLFLGALLLQSLEDGGWDARGGLALVVVAVLMCAIALAAALGPARGALRIQPTEALRSQ
jgi:putative ABC transport system permease protein